MPGTLRQRPGLSITGHGAIDQARIHRFERFITDAEPIHYTRTKPFQHDVIRLHESQNNGSRTRLLQIKRQRPLVASQYAMPCRCALVIKWRHGTDEIDARRRLNANDISAQIGKHHRAEWPRQQGGKVQDFQ